MSFSLCSLTRVSPQIHERNSQWSQNAKRSIFRLSLTNNSSRCICRVVEQGLEVEVASADTAPQKQSPVIDTKEEEQQQEVFNGVATTESDNKALNSSYTAKKKKRDDDDSYENRFKLQNGREVSYLFYFLISFFRIYMINNIQLRKLSKICMRYFFKVIRVWSVAYLSNLFPEVDNG